MVERRILHQADVEAVIAAELAESGGGGGTPAGVSVVRKFPFAYNTPGILTGAAVYTPTVGDILLDAWIEINTAWNGITPKVDVGQFNSGAGWFVMGAINSPNLSADVLNGLDSALLTGNSGPSSLLSHQIIANQIKYNGATPEAWNRNIPAKFVAIDPIKICVSQNGTNTGANPGSTQGSGILYLVTATPA